MRTQTLRTLLLPLAITVLSGATDTASAQNYPTRPLTMVVPYAAGGGSDIYLRIVSEKLSQNIGQPVLVSNRPGAGGNLGAASVASAPPDGYTLLSANIAHVISNFVGEKPNYNIITDFEPVTLLGSTPFVVIVGKHVNAINLRELIAYAKANPGKLTYGTSGLGSTSHLAVELMKARANFDILHVPYKGGAPVVPDILSGRIDITLLTGPSAVPLMNNNSAKAFAVTGKNRSPLARSVPTASEEGVPNYNVAPWYSVLAPAKTPNFIISRLNESLHQTMKDTAVETKLRDLWFDVQVSTPQEMKAFIQSETNTWKETVARAGIKAE